MELNKGFDNVLYKVVRLTDETPSGKYQGLFVDNYGDIHTNRYNFDDDNELWSCLRTNTHWIKKVENKKLNFAIVGDGFYSTIEKDSSKLEYNYPEGVGTRVFSKFIFDHICQGKKGHTISEGEYYNHRYYYASIITKVSNDFNVEESNTVNKVYDSTSSLQYRAKLIYRSKNGYYYKPHGKIVNFTEEECKDFEEFLKKSRND